MIAVPGRQRGGHIRPVADHERGARDKSVNATIDCIEANESTNPNPLNPS